jgi:DDE family transposase
MSKYTHVTSHAGLALVGQQMCDWRLWQVVEHEVTIAQKVIRHRPTDKLLDEFITILAGGAGVVEVNTRLRPDLGLQRAFGRQACAEQSTVSDTLQACTPETVAQLGRAMRTLLRQHGQAYRHAYERAWQVLDVDLTGLPAGRQAEGATKGYFAGQRNRRGRQLGRVLASRYDEIVFEQLYPGTRQLEHSLPELLTGAEDVLHLGDERRFRTLVRVDGGGGSDADLNDCLTRGYRVLAKVHNWKRAAKLAASVTAWQADPDEPTRQRGWVTQPYPYARPTQQVALRWPHPKQAECWQYAVVVCNAPATLLAELTGAAVPVEPAAELALIVAAYDQRGGGVETANKDSKHGLQLHHRNTRRFAAQQVLVLLAQLAYNLLTWVRQWLARACPALTHFGRLRLIRDVLTIAGRLRWRPDGQIQCITLNQQHGHAAALRAAFQPLLLGHGTRLYLGQF